MKDLESKNLWIQARIDELLSCDKWRAETLEDWAYDESELVYGGYAIQKAEKQAASEHAEIEAMILNAKIDDLELG